VSLTILHVYNVSDHFDRHGRMLGLPPNTWEFIKDIPCLSKLSSMMQNIFHLAAAFSPLIVLIPKKPSVDGIRRDHLLAVRFNVLLFK
jgi:hypothetical protein